MPSQLLYPPGYLPIEEHQVQPTYNTHSLPDYVEPIYMEDPLDIWISYINRPPFHLLPSRILHPSSVNISNNYGPPLMISYIPCFPPTLWVPLTDDCYNLDLKNATLSFSVDPHQLYTSEHHPMAVLGWSCIGFCSDYSPFFIAQRIIPLYVSPYPVTNRFVTNFAFLSPGMLHWAQLYHIPFSDGSGDEIFSIRAYNEPPDSKCCYNPRSCIHPCCRARLTSMYTSPLSYDTLRSSIRAYIRLARIGPTYITVAADPLSNSAHHTPKESEQLASIPLHRINHCRPRRKRSNLQIMRHRSSFRRPLPVPLCRLELIHCARSDYPPLLPSLIRFVSNTQPP
jgi:hypothetical protein